MKPSYNDMKEMEGKQVRFSDAPPEVFLIGRRTVAERRAIKYSRKEIAGFRMDLQNDIQAWKADRDYASTNCVLGLERYMGSPLEKRADYLATLQVIHDEQMRQQDLGVHDPEAIRDLAAMCSRWDRRRAHELANPNDMPKQRKRREKLLLKGKATAYEQVSESLKKNKNKTQAELLHDKAVQHKKSFKKRVRFGHCPRVTVHESSKAPQEVQQTWYTKQDFVEFRNECDFTLGQWSQGSFVDSDTHCFRGLERYLASKVKSRKAVVSLVLQEQKEQRARGVNDPDATKRLYHLCSRPQRYRAIEFGVLDEVFCLTCDESQRSKRNRIIRACRRIMAKGSGSLVRKYSLVMV